VYPIGRNVVSSPRTGTWGETHARTILHLRTHRSWQIRSQVSSRVFPCGLLAPILHPLLLVGSSLHSEVLSKRQTLSASCRERACRCCILIHRYQINIEKPGLTDPT